MVQIITNQSKENIPPHLLTKLSRTQHLFNISNTMDLTATIPTHISVPTNSVTTAPTLRQMTLPTSNAQNISTSNTINSIPSGTQSRPIQRTTTSTSTATRGRKLLLATWILPFTYQFLPGHLVLSDMHGNRAHLGKPQSQMSPIIEAPTLFPGGICPLDPHLSIIDVSTQ